MASSAFGFKYQIKLAAKVTLNAAFHQTAAKAPSLRRFHLGAAAFAPNALQLLSSSKLPLNRY
jgi:hypothetical protein